MNFLKKIFGSKNAKNAKKQSNTLAEANTIPDSRSVNNKVEATEVKSEKHEEVKKAPKISTLTPQDIANINANKSAEKKNAIDQSVTQPVKSNAVSTDDLAKKYAQNSKKSSPSAKKSDVATTAKKAESTAKSDALKAAVNPNIKVDKSASSAENDEKSVKKSATKSSAKPSTDNKNAKKETKPETDSTKKSASSKTASAQPVINNESESSEEITVTKSARTGKFEIKKSKDGRFVFNLYASNNVIVATSQVYSSSSSAMNGIKSVIANAATSPIEDQTLKNVTTVPYPKWEIYLDKGDQYRFRLCASNGSCVCHSQGYTSKANCKKGIESIIKFASDAEITKVYLEKK